MTKNILYDDESQKILVSVVICTYNGAKHLLDCLTSFEKIKTNLNWELIIINNNSTDNTQDIIDKFISDTGLKVITGTEPQKGVSYAKK